MACSGLCCASLEEPKTLMKMGLSVVLIGHINFLLGALLHGVVLRYINPHKSAWTMDYTISNMVALSSGLVGVVVGILAIVLSKNKKSRGLTWSLFTISLLSALMAAASAVGLFVSVARAIIHGGRSLLTHCRFPDAIDYSSVTNECPFDPTRIYSTTLILWVPLIVTCIIQLFFSARCFAVCVSFLGLPCCPTRKRPRDNGRAIDAVRSVEEAAPLRFTEPPTRHMEPLPIYRAPSRRITAPHRQQRPTPPPSQHLPRLHHSLPPRERQHLPRLHHSLPPCERQHLPRLHHSLPLCERQHLPRLHHSLPPCERQHLPRLHQSLPPWERQPLPQPYRERSEGPDSRTGSYERAPAQHQLLQRGMLERSSFWI